MNYKNIKISLDVLAEENYKEFVKALISFEKGIEDESVLDRLYEKFMEDDNMGLLNDGFDQHLR